jgi:hypothetical protein
MRLVVAATRHRDVCQVRPLVRHEAARVLQPEDTGGQFGRNTHCVSKALAEMPAAIAGFGRELLDRHRPWALASLPHAWA